MVVRARFAKHHGEFVMWKVEWEKVDEELEFISDSANSVIGSDDKEELNDALNDILRSVGRTKKILNGIERS